MCSAFRILDSNYNVEYVSVPQALYMIWADSLLSYNSAEVCLLFYLINFIYAYFHLRLLTGL